MESRPTSPNDPILMESTQLMIRTRDGDREAFGSLVRLVSTRAQRLAHALVGHEEDARDLAQEALLKAYRGRASYDPRQPFFPWFQRILRNTCISHLRKRRVALSVSAADEPDGPDFELLDPGPLPERLAAAREATERYRLALETLTARDREVLALRHQEDLSYREIAGTLGIKEGTVMSRLFHARRRLRAAMGGDAGLDGEADLEEPK
ncbi:MAG: RNA polymerase sigma factor [Planctomycetes bacterium]|nr:RNA polymerase sigma factor [Planctomycetota bacterium]